MRCIANTPASVLASFLAVLQPQHSGSRIQRGLPGVTEFLYEIPHLQHIHYL